MTCGFLFCFFTANELQEFLQRFGCRRLFPVFCMVIVQETRIVCQNEADTPFTCDFMEEWVASSKF